MRKEIILEYIHNKGYYYRVDYGNNRKILNITVSGKKR